MASWLPGALADEGLGQTTVVDSKRLTGGASRITSRVTVDTGAGHRHLVVQEARPGLPGLGSQAEAALLRSTQEAGAPVPAVIAAGADDSRSWLVTTAVEGETIARRILRDERFGLARERLVGQCGRALAAIHATPVEDLPLPGPVDQLDHWTSILRSLGQDQPGLEFAVAELAQTRPPPTSVCLVHGDFRLGNLIVADDGLAAVIDWELAFLGDPLADLGWLSCRAWRFGGEGAVAGLGDRRSLIEAYEAASGHSVELEHLLWWERFACLRWGIICMLQASAHLGGQHRSVELAMIGRRVCETEYDLLRHLAPRELSDCSEWTADAAGAGERGVSPHDPPGIGDLLATTEEYLRGRSSGEGSRFHDRVAANAIALVGRELELGPPQATRHGDRLASVGISGEQSRNELAERIRSGTISRADALAVLVPSTVARLVTANPRYASAPHDDTADSGQRATF